MKLSILQTARTKYVWAAVALVALKLWLVCAKPLVAYGDAGYDDRLFLELAGHIVEGDWLGPYSQFTLMKGSMYPLFIAGSFLFGLPLPLAQHLFYLLGCALLVLALRPHLRDWQALALFALLWLQPMSYHQFDILRQSIYTPLTLILFAGLCALHTRRHAPIGIRLGWGAALGISAAMFYLTREESVWIAPGAAILIIAAAWSSWRAREKTLLVPAVTAVMCAAAILTTVCALNYKHYGWFGTVEFRAPEFLRAYGALQRPISSEEIPYVSVTRETRLKLYAVSPAFAELKLWLEGTIGLAWASGSQESTGRPAEERQISGNMFMWALRDAVIASGHGRNAREALDFYNQIATEVNLACDRGEVGPVRARHNTMVPPWRDEHTQRFRETFINYTKFFVLFRDFTAQPPTSRGDAKLLRIFRDLTRWPVALSEDAPELTLGFQTRFDQWRLQTLEHLGQCCRWLCLALVLSGFGAWIWAAMRSVRRRQLDYLFIVATVALGSAFAVMLVNLAIHVLSFRTQFPWSLHYGYPLLVLFGALAWIVAAFPTTVPAEEL